MAKKSTRRTKRPRLINISIDLDALDQLYRSRYEVFLDGGDTKGGYLRRLRDGDTKGGVRFMRARDGDTKGSARLRRLRDGDTKGGIRRTAAKRRRRTK